MQWPFRALSLRQSAAYLGHTVVGVQRASDEENVVNEAEARAEVHGEHESRVRLVRFGQQKEGLRNISCEKIKVRLLELQVLDVRKKRGVCGNKRLNVERHAAMLPWEKTHEHGMARSPRRVSTLMPDRRPNTPADPKNPRTPTLDSSATS